MKVVQNGNYRNGTSDDNKSALFVTTQLRPRELKMAAALHAIGWTIDLIYVDSTPFVPQSSFRAVFKVDSAVMAHQYAEKINPKIIHVFSGAIDDYILLFCDKKIAPTVIDLNDIFAPSLFDYCHERFKLTRMALKKADGFCARDLQAKSAERIDNFKLPKNILLYPEYCLNSNPEPLTKIDDEIHIVSIGTISLETQNSFDSCYFQLVTQIIGKGIHFHIYPHWSYREGYSYHNVNFNKDFSNYIELARENKYLHIHESLSAEELAKELPKYDYGIVTGGCPVFGQKLKYYKPEYLKTCYSGRISDYLDACLPVLINDEVAYNYWILKRNRVLLDLKGVNAPDFKRKLLEYKKNNELKMHIVNTVRKLSNVKNAPRLGEFYNKVIQSSDITSFSRNNFRKSAIRIIRQLYEKTLSSNMK